MIWNGFSFGEDWQLLITTERKYLQLRCEVIFIINVGIKNTNYVCSFEKKAEMHHRDLILVMSSILSGFGSNEYF